MQTRLTRGLELEKRLILSNRRRMLPAFPSTRAPAPAASSPRRRRSDFSRTRAPASATDWGWRPSLFSSASWMAGGESPVCRDLEHTEARNTHELLNVTPRLRDEIIPVIYAGTRERTKLSSRDHAGFKFKKKCFISLISTSIWYRR